MRTRNVENVSRTAIHPCSSPTAKITSSEQSELLHMTYALVYHPHIQCVWQPCANHYTGLIIPIILHTNATTQTRKRLSARVMWHPSPIPTSTIRVPDKTRVTIHGCNYRREQVTVSVDKWFFYKIATKRTKNIYDF